MRPYLKFLLGLSGALLMSNAAHAAKAQLIPIVPFPGATSTTVFGIANDNNTIVGSYIDSGGLMHGFIGTLNGTYTSFDYGSGGTQPRDIDDKDYAIGSGNMQSNNHCSFTEWIRSADGTIAPIAKGRKALFGIARGINVKELTAGDFCQADGTILGYTGKEEKYKHDVAVPFDTPYTGPRAINKSGTIAGFYVDSGTGLQIGVLIKGGVTSTVAYPAPNQVYTVLEGLNDSGTAAGQWADTGGIVHSFIYDTNASTFTELDDPGAVSFTQAWGVNKAGLTAVNSDAGSYIYCPLRKAKCPKPGVEISIHPFHAPPASLLRYGDAIRRPWHAVPAQYKLPRGAAIQ
jgi:hypothetical protein